MQEIIREIFLDHVALVTTTNNEFVETMCGVHFHDVPQNGLSADLYHGFRP
jgi:hypothetical protein